MHIGVRRRRGGGLNVRLERASDCTGMIQIESNGADAVVLKNALLAAGVAGAVDGNDFLVSCSWLRAEAGVLQDDPAWRRAFDALIRLHQADDRYLLQMDAVRVRAVEDHGPQAGGRAALGWITGIGITPFGVMPGVSALEWQTRAATEALADAGHCCDDVDALLVGYATTLGHLMPANLLAEYLGVRPAIAFGLNVGGATGLAMLAQAVALVSSGAARCVLVVAGENRASGQSRERSIDVLAQVGHRHYEVPVGANVPGYYALLASAYLHRYDLEPTDLASLAVQMRRHAVDHPGAQFRSPISVGDVLGSRMIATPLRLLDCCPISDGGAAVVVEARSDSGRDVAITGLGHANRHQHICEANLDDLGARRSSQAALAVAGVGLDEVDIAGVYDSFTITLALLLEEIGLAPPGAAGRLAREELFSREGDLPVNTHGGLLSYGHCGVAGGMAHLAEVVTQLRREAGERQIWRRLRRGLVHADGGVLSAHVTVVLETCTEAA